MIERIQATWRAQTFVWHVLFQKRCYCGHLETHHMHDGACIHHKKCGCYFLHRKPKV
jgi:hypothetical protein